MKTISIDIFNTTEKSKEIENELLPLLIGGDKYQIQLFQNINDPNPENTVLEIKGEWNCAGEVLKKICLANKGSISYTTSNPEDFIGIWKTIIVKV